MTLNKTKQLQEEYNQSQRAYGNTLNRSTKREQKSNYPHKQITVIKYAIHILWIVVIAMFIHSLMVY